MKNKKICFIACVNNEKYWQECQLYLSRLVIPEGYDVDILAIWEATSMCSGYNEGMQASDADIKIYMHQDVFITDIYFLQELVDIFAMDADVGMVGLVGSVGLPEEAVVWNGPRVSTIHRTGNDRVELCGQYTDPSTKDIVVVDAIDGLLMATSVDIKWREDIFTGWDFYDMSQSQEMIRAGYKVVVPILDKPVAVHDDGMVLNLLHYDEYREIFITEYMN